MASRHLDFTSAGRLEPQILRHLNRCAQASLEPFDAMIAELSRNQTRNIDWWVSQPASRNVFTSELFHRCVQIALVKELLADGDVLTVRVNDPAMASVLRQMNHSNLRIESPYRPPADLFAIRQAIHGIGSSLFHSLFAALAAKIIKRRLAHPSGTPLTALDVFVLQDSFPNGAFRDRYYPHLEDALRADEHAKFVYLPSFYRIRNYFAVFKAMRQAAIQFLAPHDYLGLGDYLFAFGHWVRLGRIRLPSPFFAGLDVSSLVWRDLRRGRFAQSAIAALLLYRFWSRRCPLRVHRVIDWYEGQGIDHAMAAAINWHNSEIELTGFRPACSRFELSVFPAEHEIAAAVVPTTMAIIGAGFEREMAGTRPSLRTVLAPGFRHTKLKDIAPKPHATPTILVTLPLLAQSVKGLAAIISNLIGNPGNHEKKWLIKRHPAMPQVELERLLPSLGGNFEFVEGDFYEILPRVDLVMGLESSALLEAVAVGIPAVCLAQGNIPTLAPFPDWADQNLCSVCYDAQETETAITTMLKAGKVARDTQTNLWDLLSPATPESIRSFLRLD